MRSSDTANDKVGHMSSDTGTCCEGIGRASTPRTLQFFVGMRLGFVARLFDVCLVYFIVSTIFFGWGLLFFTVRTCWALILSVILFVFFGPRGRSPVSLYALKFTKELFGENAIDKLADQLEEKFPADE